MFAYGGTKMHQFTLQIIVLQFIQFYVCKLRCSKCRDDLVSLAGNYLEHLTSLFCHQHNEITHVINYPGHVTLGYKNDGVIIEFRIGQSEMTCVPSIFIFYF